MVKKQQMGWSQRGSTSSPDRYELGCSTKSGENTFRRWYPDFRPQGQAKKAG